MLKESVTQGYFKFWKRRNSNFYYSLVNISAIAEEFLPLVRELYAKLTTSCL
jgi:hypothetical protein